MQKYKQSKTVKTSNPLAKAFVKFYGIEGIDLPSDMAEQFATEFKKSQKPKVVKKFIDISKMV